MAKTYKNTTLKSKAPSRFEENLKKIEEHNKGPSTYKLGLTKFVDLSPKEFQEKRLSRRFQRGARVFEKTLLRGPLGNLSKDPVDWRAKGAVTPGCLW